MKENVVFACDIGGSKLLCGFLTEDGKIICKKKIPLLHNTSISILEDNIETLFEELYENNPEIETVACGINIPGLADAKNGIWTYSCFSGIENYPISKRIAKKLKLPVFIENDVNACALAEQTYGICRDCDNFLWVTVSNGVGGGLVLNGKIYRGAFGGAGEFGHIVIEPDGLPCPCGHHGCIEALAAGPAISKRYEAITKKRLTAESISVLARSGDENAVSVMKKTGEYIGTGLGKVASILNLEKYVLGGGVMQSFDLIKEDIESAFRKEAFAFPNQKTEILPTGLKYEAGLLGAATTAWLSLK